MQNPFERALEAVPFYFGEILVQKRADDFVLCHRDDQARDDLEMFQDPEDAIKIARYDDEGNYRPLKTAPNLRHGWRMQLRTLVALKCALDLFYPGRLAVFLAWQRGQLRTTALRETLDRQSGMYRIATKISDVQIDDLVADFCRSNGGCLRTILWKRDQRGAVPSTKLSTQKFDPTWYQVQALDGPGSSYFSKTASGTAIPATIPLLCQEACNLLVAACRKEVKAE
jgi:sirohydrochlorin cobaltochelatase